jgi:hypothetical protein
MSTSSAGFAAEAFLKEKSSAATSAPNLQSRNLDRILRIALRQLGGYDEPARVWVLALSNPDLPVHVGLPKGDCIALDSVDNATAKVL